VLQKFLSDTFPFFLDKLENKIKDGSPYLCSNSITLADLVMFSHFWKIIFNPKAETPIDQIKEVVNKYPKVTIWMEKMN